MQVYDIAKSQILCASADLPLGAREFDYGFDEDEVTNDMTIFFWFFNHECHWTDKLKEADITFDAGLFLIYEIFFCQVGHNHVAPETRIALVLGEF